jgi:hypothetical protein
LEPIKFAVREVTAYEDTAWDELVYASQQKSLFLQAEFLKMWVETDPDLHMLRLGCYDENRQLVGGQTILHRRAFGVRLQNIVSIMYASTPILHPALQADQQAAQELLFTLLLASKKHFPYMRIEFNPSLSDVRPFLAQGWRAAPEYSHIWDISDPEVILKNMHRKRTYVRKAQETLLFARETGDVVLKEFFEQYKTTMGKYDWIPTPAWETSFYKRVKWLEGQNCMRLYTCRTKTGALVGAALYILSRPNQTAYFWMVSYDHTLDCKEFPPAIHWYAANELSPEFKYIDFSDGNTPSLYVFKDSLGTTSERYWVLTTPNAKRWLNFYYGVKKAKQTITNLLP